MVPEMAAPWVEGKVARGRAQGPVGSDFLPPAVCGSFAEICMDAITYVGGGQ